MESVRGIAGEVADTLHPVSNDGKSPAQLKEELGEVLGSGPAVVFVDIQAGSCGMAALSSCRQSGERVVVCGVNLPMLLDFVFHRDLPLDDLVARVVEKGRGGITRPVPLS